MANVLTVVYSAFGKQVIKTACFLSWLMDNYHLCLCGKLYDQQSALSNHQRTCKSAKMHLSSMLSRAKEFIQSAKRHRVEAAEPAAPPHNSSSHLSTLTLNFPITSNQVIFYQSTLHSVSDTLYRILLNCPRTQQKMHP